MSSKNYKSFNELMMENTSISQKASNKINEKKNPKSTKIENLFFESTIENDIKKSDHFINKKKKDIYDINETINIMNLEKPLLQLSESKDNKKYSENIVNKVPGTYVAVDFQDESVNELNNIINQLGLKKDFDDNFHTTIAFSKKYFSFFPKSCGSKSRKRKFVPRGQRIVKVIDIGHFNTDAGKNLHIVLKSKFCESEHIRAKNAGATYDHNKYIPHITIMYDCKDFDIHKFKKESPDIFNNIIGTNLILKDEYIEKLNNNWVD